MNLIKKLAVCVLLVVSSVASTGCSTNPATGETQFAPISFEQERSLGASAAPKFTKEYGGEVPDAQVVSYVRTIGRTLLTEAEIIMREHVGDKAPKYDWEFHVVDSQVINAFALPGGKVYISRGLMERLEDESQLAGVLGHEIGHVTARHIAQQMGRQMIVQGGLTAAAVAAGVSTKGSSSAAQLASLGVKAGQAGGTLYLLKFGRDQETQADELGIQYMTRVGYNPIGQMRVMEILGEASKGSRPPEFLSTHPHSETRVANIQRILKEEYPDYRDTSKYKVNREAFQAMLARLKQLPPPRHGTKRTSKAIDQTTPATQSATASPAVATPVKPVTKRPAFRWVKGKGIAGQAVMPQHLSCYCHGKLPPTYSGLAGTGILP